MDHSNINTELSKNKHLIFLERMTIELRLKYGFSAYKISKELGRSINNTSWYNYSNKTRKPCSSIHYRY